LKGAKSGSMIFENLPKGAKQKLIISLYLGIKGKTTLLKGENFPGTCSNVAEEEIAKQFLTERREMIFCAIPMTEKWPFLHMMTEKRPFWF
jgi:hypothetical protein